ncbi:MAG: glycosyltransferase [Gemmatimonadetes bacterium]|nr:glycosyltransferase [Gemmatimonadota bacterium]
MARALVQAGTQVVVVAPHEQGVPQQETVDGIEIHRFRYFLPESRQRVAYGGGIPTNVRNSWLTRVQVPFFLLAFALAARRWGRDCDLFHCQWTMTALVAWLASAGSSRPILLSVRGSDMLLSEHPLGLRLNRWLVSRADRITAVSEQIAGRLADHGVAHKTQVVANGVSDRFQPRDRSAARQALGLPVDAVICLFVGMLIPVKGLDFLLSALQQVVDERLLCVLVGDGPERQALERQAEENGLVDRVSFAGACPSDQVPAWLAACDFLVLSSLSEGRPNVILEAHASGRATLATDVGGTGELIEDGRTGLLVPSQDMAAMVAALQRLTGDADLRDRLGSAARERLTERGLTWAGTATAMRRIYDQLFEESVCAASSAA